MFCDPDPEIHDQHGKQSVEKPVEEHQCLRVEHAQELEYDKKDVVQTDVSKAVALRSVVVWRPWQPVVVVISVCPGGSGFHDQEMIIVHSVSLGKNGREQPKYQCGKKDGSVRGEIYFFKHFVSLLDRHQTESCDSCSREISQKYWMRSFNGVGKSKVGKSKVKSKKSKVGRLEVGSIKVESGVEMSLKFNDNVTCEGVIFPQLNKSYHFLPLVLNSIIVQ